MDKTLLRPLFQKRFMELHKPVKAFAGLFAQKPNSNENMQVANLMPDASAPVVDVKKTGLPSPGIFEALKQGFDKSNEATRIKKNVEAIDEGRKKTDGIMSLSPKEDEKLSPDVQKELLKLSQQGQILEESQKIVGKPASEPLFSDGEKKGIFAAQLAMALAQPGDPFANLAGGLGMGAMSLADLKATEAELDAQKVKFSKTKEAIDSTTGKPVFVTEAQIQTVMNPDGSPRYAPKGETANLTIGAYKVRQKDGTYKNLNVPKHLVAKAFLAGDVEKYLPIDKESGDEIKVVKLLKEYGGLKKNEFFHVTESDLRKDLERAPEDRIFGPAKLTGNQIAENLLLSEGVREKFKKQSKLGDEMNRAEPVIDLIYEIERDLTKVKAGSIGAIARGAGKLESLGEFVGISRDNDEYGYENYSNVKQAIENPEQFAIDQKLSKDEADKFMDIASVFETETQKLSAELQTKIIELAYAIAKSREEGGRFSVSDIELAMQSINAGIDSEQFKSSLRALGRRVLRQPLLNYRRFYENEPNKLKGEQYQKLKKALEEFSGVKGTGKPPTLEEEFD